MSEIERLKAWKKVDAAIPAAAGKLRGAPLSRENAENMVAALNALMVQMGSDSRFSLLPSETVSEASPPPKGKGK